jgi:hypothetical protein
VGKRKSDGDKLIGAVLIALGAACLYYLKAGATEKDNAALIPDAVEDRVDALVAALNARVGKDCVKYGAEALKLSLRGALPVPIVALVNVVYAVEQESKRVSLSSTAKRQRASAMAARY